MMQSWGAIVLTSSMEQGLTLTLSGSTTFLAGMKLFVFIKACRCLGSEVDGATYRVKVPIELLSTTIVRFNLLLCVFCETMEVAGRFCCGSRCCNVALKGLSLWLSRVISDYGDLISG